MSISSYDELKTAIASWLARDDLTDNIPDFITLAETKLNRTLYHPSMELRATVSVDTGTSEPQYVSLPDDFQSMRRLRLFGVTGKPTLDFLSEIQANKFRTANADTAGQPWYYTIFGDELELLPTPDSDYELEMVYRGTIPALSDSNTSNWLLEFAPDVYLYGSLLQSAPFVRDNDGVQMWGAAYQAALEELNKHGKMLKYGQTPLVVTVVDTVTP